MGSAYPNRCVGESRRILYYPKPNHFAKSSFPGKLAVFPDPFRLKSEELTFVIANRTPVFYYHAHAHAERRARAHV